MDKIFPERSVIQIAANRSFESNLGDSALNLTVCIVMNEFEVTIWTRNISFWR